MKNLSQYLQRINIQAPTTEALNNFVENVLSPASINNISNEKIKTLYQYDIPNLTDEGACGIKSQEPFRLDKALKIENTFVSPHTLRLLRLNRIITKIQSLTQVDWIGIYPVREDINGEPVLQKEAYYGNFSRAQFPINEDFAKNSNNSTVALNQTAILIQSIKDYQDPYYICDTQVQSEYCLPILSPQGNLLGIIDAEAFEPNFFDDNRIAQITKVAQDLGSNAHALLF